MPRVPGCLHSLVKGLAGALLVDAFPSRYRMVTYLCQQANTFTAARTGGGRISPGRSGPLPGIQEATVGGSYCRRSVEDVMGAHDHCQQPSAGQDAVATHEPQLFRP